MDSCNLDVGDAEHHGEMFLGVAPDLCVVIDIDAARSRGLLDVQASEISIMRCHIGICSYGRGDAVMRSVPVRLLVGLLALTVARSGQAQQMRTGYVNKYHTCRGDSGTHIRIVRLPNDEVALTTVVVFGVDSLSPVGRAGLRNGDQVTLMNGVDLTHLVRGVVAYRDAPGDTNVWKIRNAAGEREIRFVVGHWVKVGADSVCRNDGTATQHPETPPSSK